MFVSFFFFTLIFFFFLSGFVFSHLFPVYFLFWFIHMYHVTHTNDFSIKNTAVIRSFFTLSIKVLFFPEVKLLMVPSKSSY